MKHGFGANGSIEVVEDEQAGAGGRNFDLVYSPARLRLALELEEAAPWTFPADRRTAGGGRGSPGPTALV